MSIFFKIFISVSLTTIISISLFVNYIINIKEKEADNRLNNKIEYHKKINKTTISHLLFDLNKEILIKNLSSLYLDDDIAKIELIDYSKVIEFTLNNKNIKEELIKSKTQLEIDDEILGELLIYYSKYNLHKNIDDYKKSILEISIFLVILLLLIIYYFVDKFVKSIKELTMASTQITSGNLDFNININSKDEIGILANKFNAMRNSLKNRIATINEQLNFQQSLMHSVNIPIFIKNENGKYIDCNKAFTDFYGIEKEEIIGQNISKIIKNQEVDIYRLQDEKVINDEIDIVCEVKLLNKDNKLRDVILNKNIYINKKKKEKMIIGTYFDITEMNQAKQEIELFNEELQKKVYARTEELEESNEELQATISNLKQTQDKLVESEKLASLGSLVAGVAHEINTPIGIGLTGITHLLEESKKIQNLYDEEKMSEEDFEKYLKESNELCNLINSNLERTAQLIKSFKQISVDQTSEEKREFKLNQYISGILLSLTNVIKKANVKVNFNYNEDKIINSYPGVLSQIITNLVINSISHAFDDTNKKEILIDTKFEDNKITIIYEDNGKGIKTEHRDKIFEPFFTTNRKKGNTGLGMNVIYNIITKTFNGSIKCVDKETKGVKFIITLEV